MIPSIWIVFVSSGRRCRICSTIAIELPSYLISLILLPVEIEPKQVVPERITATPLANRSLLLPIQEILKPIRILAVVALLFFSGFCKSDRDIRLLITEFACFLVTRDMFQTELELA
ncbi:unnamed protein product [Brassica napus]|uniref:(rape) hypothetical protein n=1 Tax=Brassica napus TaxID=3708 RepID=A0A816LG33_BRANA|nr:unnamed protein product [Brassica napus]